MTEDVIEFGASDLGGPKHTPPKHTNTPETELTNELIKRKAWSRKFALGAILLMSASALGCLGFAMYVGCHFLGVLEKHDRYSQERVLIADQPVAPLKQEVLTAKTGSQKDLPTKTNVPASTKAEPATPSPDSEKLYLSALAPLIPATFSSALAIILFITIARLVTNFERMGKEGSEKETPEDYGAIATLVQEIGKLVQSLRGK